MPRHEDLLDEGAREAPEPETAEERSSRLGMKSAAGGVVAGGAVLAKVGVLGKLFLWIFAWDSISSLWRIGGWIAIAVVAALVAVYLVVRSRREHA